MARTKTNLKSTRTDSSVKVERSSSPVRESGLNFDFQNNRSIINLVLGAAVLVVLAVVVFNFFSNQKPANPGDLGPSQQTDNNTPPQGDVAKENLPGKYTVKEGDTLFTIAQNYYSDGHQYNQIVAANKLTDENNIQTGQVLDIPKLPDNIAMASPVASITPDQTPAPAATQTPAATQAPTDQAVKSMDMNQASTGTGGDPSQTEWGTRISGNTYTVQAGDWLSKIAGRSYGDVMSYTKIAQANKIANPNLIEPGTVLTIPR